MMHEPTPDRTDGGYDARAHYCPPLDSREQMRRRNLADAERIILGTPAIAAVIREVSDKWAKALSKLPDQPPCHDWPSRDDLPTTDPDE
jgi:hypothetical protein